MRNEQTHTNEMKMNCSKNKRVAQDVDGVDGVDDVDDVDLMVLCCVVLC